MKVSNKVIKQLGRLLAGDTGVAPYRSGPDLVDFFNDCGYDDIYGEGFPSRWLYAAQKIEDSNSTDRLRLILEEFVDPRRYGGDEKWVQTIVDQINSCIKYDGYSLLKNGHLFKMSFVDGSIVQTEIENTVDHDFIAEQVKKCQQKIAGSDFNGAVTNARSLVEAVLIHVIEQLEGEEIRNEGNLEKLWNRCKKALKMEFTKEDLPEFALQILSGLDTLIKGLAGLSNNAGDRHANKFKTRRHHAKLAVNTAMTISDYVIELMNFKQTMIKV